MMQRKFIFGCLAGLLFMAFTAVNVTVSKSYSVNKKGNEFSLSNLTAKATSTQEFECSTEDLNGICTSVGGTDCAIPADPCTKGLIY